MPDYTINVTTDVVLDREGLDALEDAVYDELTTSFGGSIAVVADGVGVTDVAAEYN